MTFKLLGVSLHRKGRTWAQISSGSSSLGPPNKYLIWCSASPPSLKAFGRTSDGSRCQTWQHLQLQIHCHFLFAAWWMQIVDAELVGCCCWWSDSGGGWVAGHWRVTVKLVNRSTPPHPPKKEPSSRASPCTCPDPLSCFAICHTPLSSLLWSHLCAQQWDGEKWLRGQSCGSLNLQASLSVHPWQKLQYGKRETLAILFDACCFTSTDGMEMQSITP